MYRFDASFFFSKYRTIGIAFLVVIGSFLVINLSIFSSQKTFIVVIDASHGGDDEGTTADHAKLAEKDIVLSVAKKLQKQSKEIHYIMSRKKDVTMGLDHRIDLANKIGADLLLSIHVNESGGSEISGPEAHYYDLGVNNAASMAFCELLAEKVKINNKPIIVRSTEFRILREPKCPSVLLHLGYITNPSDAEFLSSSQNQSQIAEDINAVVMAYREL